MPRLKGLELREQINQNEFLRRQAIPFVFLTTAANPQTVRQAYDESVQGYYQKSVTPAGLRKQLHLIIECWQSCLHPNSFNE